MRGKFSHQVKGGTLKGVWVGELCTHSRTVVRLRSEEVVPRVSESQMPGHRCHFHLLGMLQSRTHVGGAPARRSEMHSALPGLEEECRVYLAVSWKLIV